MIGEDLVQRCVDVADEGPILVLSHPASGTQWLCDQLAHVLDGPVAHELMRGKRISEYKAVVTYHQWQRMTLEKYANVFVSVRDPIRVIPSATKLFDSSPIFRAMWLSHFFGDGWMLGDAVATVHQMPPHLIPIVTLLRFYELAEERYPTTDNWFRIEDAKAVTEEARVGRKATVETSYKRLAELGVSRELIILLDEKARRYGYDGGVRELF